MDESPIDLIDHVTRRIGYQSMVEMDRQVRETLGHVWLTDWLNFPPPRKLTLRQRISRRWRNSRWPHVVAAMRDSSSECASEDNW